MAEEPYEEIDLVVDKEKFDALVAEDDPLTRCERGEVAPLDESGAVAPLDRGQRDVEQFHAIPFRGRVGLVRVARLEQFARR